MSVLKQFEHLKIQLEAIESATNNFAQDNCIGKGGFGKVYKGELLHSKGHTTVAIKRLDRAFGQGDSEFWKEVIMLSVYKHINIVFLLGFCDEKGEKILVYEYAARRSLDLHLVNKDLTWVRRLRICIGAARGLAYLHNPAGTQQRVLHRDIKSSNILLDEDWNTRIADLGLSKFGPANQKYTFLITNNRVGIVGYCDPLYLGSGILTKESDVYSFGVVLFEVLCGRLCFERDDKAQSFVQLVRKHYKQKKLNEIIWGNIKDEIHPSSLEVFSTIAYRCLKNDSEKRPLMENVVKELETALKYQVDVDRVMEDGSRDDNVKSFISHEHDDTYLGDVVGLSMDVSKGVEDVATDCKTHKVVVKGQKVHPMKVLEMLQKSHRQVELLSPIPKPPAQELKVEEKEAPKPEEKKEEPPQVITVTLKVQMHCESCAQEIRKRILRIKGVENVEIDLKSSHVSVKGTFTAPRLKESIRKRTGKDAVIIKQDPEPKREDDKGSEVKTAEYGGGEKKEEKKGEENGAGGEGKAKEKEEENKEEKKQSGGEEARKLEDGGGRGQNTRVVELRKNEFYYYPDPPIYTPLHGPYQPAVPLTQMFSDENANACTVM